MSTQETETDPDLDEVAFWRRFIDWWEAKEGRPATARMREALAYAEERRASEDGTRGLDQYSKPKDAHDGNAEETGRMSPPASGFPEAGTFH